ncbi:hypothetical protein A6046_05890 [[Haemophilus] ducreyi]|nr:terminus macrodomain insulation protein YfbV [[Haemophilus] ducreyi]AKO37144.1 membrane protein [[Haemophilus] ducreyi]AKO38604.1 membrane protein [[Haemophilus] ducreyi]AKO40143.1 membrane protein [[Haemophilus] ducreyi]AKO41628.1 membrane protein [[Haemophilus] ducreyi]AKO43053.1 membrane protein [[Haemophilus] ducreyi]
MINTIQLGQRYLETYPNQKKLALFMPDYRLIRLVKQAARFMPIFACFAILWQYFFTDPTQSILANAIITSLFAISLPYQGLYWLGKRANTPLPLSLLDWYQSLKQKLISEQKIMQDQAVPSYQDFANLLKLAEETWGDNYFNEL